MGGFIMFIFGEIGANLGISSNMIKSVTVYDRRRVNGMLTGDWQNPYSDCPWAIISIYTRSNEALLTLDAIENFKSKGMIDFLSLQFWDIDDRNKEAILSKYPEAIFFDKSHAMKIIDFVCRINSQNPDKEIGLIVHCDAGISRSGAVGLFIVEYLSLDVKDFFKRRANLIQPNGYVLSILRRTANIIPSFEGIIIQKNT